VAHRQALQTGKPIFIYFTKTYCPHCVVMEKELLANEVLQPAYSKIVWLYVFRDFSGNERDRAAERVSLRFGLTSWPQHLLIDPASLAVIGDTGRSAKRFHAAVDRANTRVKPSRNLDMVARVEKATSRAIALEKSATIETALKSLADDDIVVRYRALQFLAEKQPGLVASHALQLLKTPNDPFRFEVCNVLAKVGDAEAANALHELVKRPTQSRNPNVLRITAVKALATCGTAESIPVIAPYATSGAYLNSLTSVSVKTLANLAQRDPELRPTVREILLRSYPQPNADPSVTQKRYCTNLARQVHAALEGTTGKKVSFPTEYDRAARTLLIESW